MPEGALIAKASRLRQLRAADTDTSSSHGPWPREGGVFSTVPAAGGATPRPPAHHASQPLPFPGSLTRFYQRESVSQRVWRQRRSRKGTERRKESERTG